MEASLAIRPVRPADTPLLVALAEGTGVFKPIELVALREVLDDFHAGNAAAGHQAIAVEDGDAIAGFAYFAPAAMTDRAWNLWWIAVDASRHRQGLGRRLMERVERAVRGAAGRCLLIETSSLDHYEPTRAFYQKLGYRPVATVPDFYADGDHQCLFAKRMDGQETAGT